MRMRHEYTFMAKLAEQAHRYEDMVEWMDELVLSSSAHELTPEERNLFAAAYKHLIGPLRHALLTIEHKDPVHVALVNEYKVQSRVGTLSSLQQNSEPIRFTSDTVRFDPRVESLLLEDEGGLPPVLGGVQGRFRERNCCRGRHARLQSCGENCACRSFADKSCKIGAGTKLLRFFSTRLSMILKRLVAWRERRWKMPLRSVMS
ncbi:general regulatory factor 8 [Actinidia rufa]|uniref:General regulatory factor 8 n=1 Tax=Actinidia rufa TaxID=165716 RepID=A0A7J0GX92_9ERIC|nr:general regulatory factor 8 [Actinidia rufa]